MCELFLIKFEKCLSFTFFGGLKTIPKDDTGLSVSKAVYGSPLTVPGEFLGSPELPPSSYLSKIEQAVAGFTFPPPHHVLQSPPCQQPAVLMSAKYVFIQEDASTPSLAPLYRGPYLMLEQRYKFFLTIYYFEFYNFTKNIGTECRKIKKNHKSFHFHSRCVCCPLSLSDTVAVRPFGANFERKYSTSPHSGQM